MISSYKQLSSKYLKGNMKRTILTLIGIILSVALISTVGLFMKGSQLSQIENIKKLNGFSFHFGISNYNEALVNKIKYNPLIASYGFMSQGGIVSVGEVSVQKNFADHSAMEFLTYSLVDGRLPANDREAAVDSWTLPYMKEGLQIGDSFELDGQTYQLVGLLDNRAFTQNKKVGRLLTYKHDFTIGEGRILAEINEKANFQEVLEEIKSLTEDENLVINEELIRVLKPGSNQSILAVLVIVVSIVVIATVVVIYNAFQISVVERMKQFGLLRSIGATRKQIRQIVMREAAALAVIAIPVGLVCSILAVAALQSIFTILLEDGAGVAFFQIDWRILFISSIITLTAVLASSYYPAFFAGRISPLLAISSRLSIKKEAIKKHKNNVLKKPLSFPLSLAFKNVKRNKNRYTITILSIIISSVLFITFSSMMDIAFASKYVKDLSTKSDLSISLQQDHGDFSAERQQILELLKSVENVSGVKEQDLSFEIELKDKTQSVTTVAHIDESVGKKHVITIVNHIDENKVKKDSELVIKVLVYSFITVISLIGSLNILNTITISIIIRRKELAALKAIGMSQENLKKMIIYEALIYGFSGSLQGIFFGCILSYIIYLAASGVLKVEWTIPYEACLITFVSALFISFLSVLIPLRKIQKDNLIDVIREQ
ncbi:ABC transporter permease [Brevibacillus brevis]|uniref:ABC transporter permease n=1 Tax=Brevibacillus brevis TaxID=1393 RepID=UPI000D0F476F|nr:ABC transporter permease [Brevibacillus brevis]PSJ68332.1 ABC transporter permease [Brevibacillus brevis]RED35638.1 putative ABC transport system permease protein [Brevibacillus brevis]VEF89251.1 macrolide transporter ATP-binding /permease protein [Brevibacillus brevis]